MTIQWDEVGKKQYETGIDHGVLYLQNASGTYPKGVAWSGLVSVSESPSGAEPSPMYADNIKYQNLLSAEDFGATVEAFMTPDEFAECDGSAEISTGVFAGQQTHKPFGLCYRTILGNDTEGNDHGYKLHIIYGATAKPSEKAYTTVNDSPEGITFSYELSTTPVAVPGFKPTASLVVDSTTISAAKLAALEAVLYGTETEEARLPLPAEIITLTSTSTSTSDTPAG